MITRRIVTAAGGKQQQADWLENDSSKPSYIRNKPTIDPGLHYEIVETLPTEDIDPSCIYLVPSSDPSQSDVYDEYMYINNAWEKLGNTGLQQIQSDWDETDQSSPAFIANKPATLDFVVPFTEVNDAVSTTVAKADIIAAINAGKDVRATLNDEYFELVAYSESPEKMSFSAVLDDTTVSIVGKVVNNNWVWETYDTELNVQADWNESDVNSPAYIDNKPTLATVATTGDYTDLSNTPSLATVATSGDYDDLTNKPTIPTVNDATITIQQNGTTVGTFTTNDANDTTINLTGGGSNDWFGTQAEFDALQSYDEDTNYHIEEELATVAFTGDYTDLSNTPSLATVATTGDYSDLSNTPTVPTQTSELTNDGDGNGNTYVLDTDLQSGGTYAIPTHTSQLFNDGDGNSNVYVLDTDLQGGGTYAIPTQTSQLMNDGDGNGNNYITTSDIYTYVPTQTSQLMNDGDGNGYAYATTNDLPSLTSDLMNDGEGGGTSYILNTDLQSGGIYDISDVVKGVDVTGTATALTLRIITQSDYDALVQGGTVDANTVYMIN